MQNFAAIQKLSELNFQSFKSMKKKVKKKTISKLKKEADAVFSRFIRYRDKGICFTCGHRNDPKKMQNGHFVPRQFNSTRYNEKNCNCQCYACNMFYGGQPDIYTLKLQEKYGEGIIKELNALRQKTKQWLPVELEELIKIYQQKLEELNV